MHEFKHPKHYAALRAELRKLQAHPMWEKELQASSVKPQADESSKRQASSPKHKASSFKPQATSSVIREPRNM